MFTESEKLHIGNRKEIENDRKIQTNIENKRLIEKPTMTKKIYFY